LYDVFLHELGHLQLINPQAQSDRRRFAGETKAQQFADEWRSRLWTEPFVHPDPIHNSASTAEMELLQDLSQLKVGGKSLTLIQV
jgi:hypothetical protein